EAQASEVADFPPLPFLQPEKSDADTRRYRVASAPQFRRRSASQRAAGHPGQHNRPSTSVKKCRQPRDIEKARRDRIESHEYESVQKGRQGRQHDPKRPVERREGRRPPLRQGSTGATTTEILKTRECDR